MLKNSNLKNAITRLEETGDIFKGVLGKGINITRALKKMNSIFEFAPANTAVSHNKF
jgi:bifunctional non-homologous end joining protein LigD